MEMTFLAINEMRAHDMNRNSIHICNIRFTILTEKIETEASMSGPQTFVWNADNDQIYDSRYGSQKIQQDPQNYFSKASGKMFTMDAPGCTATITTENSPSWGFSPPNTPAIFNIKNGSFAASTSGLSIPASGGVIINVYSNMQIQTGLFNAEATPEKLNINVYTGAYTAKTALYLANHILHLYNASTASIAADNVFNLAEGKTTTENQSKLSLSAASTGASITDHRFDCSDSSSIYFAGDSPTFSGQSEVHVRDGARMAINGGSISIKDDTRFFLHDGLSPTIQFSATPGTSPFDFYNHTYPEGIFNFVGNTSAPPNPDRAFIFACDYTAFDGGQAIKSRLFAIDGVIQDENSPRLVVKALTTGAFKVYLAGAA
jgi:hypothetical protein